MTHWLRRNWLWLLAHILALTPLLLLLINYLRDDLTFDPIRYVMLRTGEVGLILVVLALACTPVSILLGWRQAVQIRRPLGVYGFLYVTLHLLVYAVWENELDLRLIWRDLGERRAMSVGLIAFAALIPLALTSTNSWQRRLGTRWRTLHRLVYVATPLSVLHFYWLDRDFKGEPLTYAGVVALLLLVRVSPVRQALGRWRRAGNK
jgi:sulfoxide reductase heme-binding subunit YedZ